MLGALEFTQCSTKALPLQPLDETMPIPATVVPVNCTPLTDAFPAEPFQSEAQTAPPNSNVSVAGTGDRRVPGDGRPGNPPIKATLLLEESG